MYIYIAYDIFLRYTVFVLQSPAYLPIYLAPEAVRKSIRRIFDHSFPRQPSCLPHFAVHSQKVMALDLGNNDSFIVPIYFSMFTSAIIHKTSVVVNHRRLWILIIPDSTYILRTHRIPARCSIPMSFLD